MKGNLYVADKGEIKQATTGRSLKGKYINMEIFQNRVEESSKKVTLTYTIRPGDGKRLNREGFLMVYNFSQPIKIPLTKLLGRWKSTHIGITLSCRNGEWIISEPHTNHILPVSVRNTPATRQLFFARIKRLTFKYGPLALLEKLCMEK